MSDFLTTRSISKTQLITGWKDILKLHITSPKKGIDEIFHATLIVKTKISPNFQNDTQSHLDYQEYQGQPKLPKTLVAIWSQFYISLLKCNPIFCRYHHKPGHAHF